MSGLSFDEQSKWREDLIESFTCHKGRNRYAYDICNPVDYYNFKNPCHESEKEVMRFDLNKVRNSDLVVANFNDPKSLGTMAEITVAFEREIPVIGLNINNEELHPWQIEICNRVFNSLNALVVHIIGFYLN